MIPGGFVKQNHSLFSFLQQLIDVAMVWGGFHVAAVVMGVSWTHGYGLADAISTLLYFLFAQRGNLYASWRGQSLLGEFRQVFISWFSMLLVMLLVAYALKVSHQFSRRVIGTWVVMTPFILCGFRLVLRLFLRHLRASGRNSRRVAIAGTGAVAMAVARNIASSPWRGLNLHGFYDDLDEASSKPIPELDAVVRGSLPQLIAEAKRGDFDEIYIALPMRAELKTKILVQALADTSAQVQYVPDIFTFNLLNSRIRDLGGIPVISVYDTPLDSVGRLVKRLEDIALSTLILILIALPMLGIAAAVRFSSPGPVFFRQRRYGLSGEEILIWKFRTMTVCEDGADVRQATRADARLTRVGSLLRKTSLDELPQFFNVLQGSMSIVGPRPHAVVHNEMYRNEIEGYMQRHLVKPGITGWAQINGWRGETDCKEKMQKRVEHDMHYIRNWSVWFDFKIIFLTVARGFLDKNAY